MLAIMDNAPAFLDQSRPAVPDIAVPRGVNPFYLPLRPVRGRLIKLGPLAAALLDRHNYPPCVTPLAGQALVAVAALATALKFTGSFSLQIKGDGPVRMLLADCTDGGALRGYASVDDDKLNALLAEHPHPTPKQLLGEGYLAFTVDQGPDMERHQGIVALEGETLEEMALHYFHASEQTACFLRLACAETEHGWRASALVFFPMLLVLKQPDLGMAVSFLPILLLAVTQVTSVDQLTWARFLTGFGVGGVIANTIALNAEMAPQCPVIKEKKTPLAKQ